MRVSDILEKNGADVVMADRNETIGGGMVRLLNDQGIGMARVVDYAKIRLSILLDPVVACLKSCSGATAIEYAIIAAFVAVAIITALNFLGVELSALFDRLASVFERECVKVGSNCDGNK